MALLGVLCVRVHGAGNGNEVAQSVEYGLVPVDFHACDGVGVAAEDRFRAHIDGVVGYLQLVLVEQGLAGAAAVEVDDYVVRDLLGVEDVVRHVAHAAGIRDGVDGRGGSARFRPVVAVGGGYTDVGAACLHNCGVAFARACKVVVQERELNAFALYEGRLSGLVVVDAGSAGLDAVLVEVFHGIEYAVGALVKAMVSAYCGYVESGVLESAQILHVRRRRGMRLHVAPARPVGVRIFHVADGDISGP